MTESEASVASSLDANYDSDAEISTIKSSLQDCLDNVKTAGSFATSGLLPDTTLSGLFVHNVGSIGFPLQEEQAKAIVGACHRAPFGQGKSYPMFIWKSVSLPVVQVIGPLSTNL